jgi:hypothetical protein
MRPEIPSTIETTYVPNIIQGVELGRESSMDAEELLVHYGSEWERAERVHAGVIQAFGILTLTYTGQPIRGPIIITNVNSHSSLKVK